MQNVLHRDIKSQNIFVKGSCLLLGDFGIAKRLTSSAQLSLTCIGTPCYMSPEIISSRPYTFATDVWSLGCVMHELCNLTRPFKAATNFQELVSMVNNG